MRSRNLGYSDDEIDKIVAYIDEHKTIIGAPVFKGEHLPVFACSMGDNTIHYMGHVKMMAAVQPFISGAISKTVNMPEEATVEDVEELYLESWRLGLKAVALYRDNCKVGQPLSTQKKAAPTRSRRRSSGSSRRSSCRSRCARSCRGPASAKTFSFRVADCHGYVTVGEYEDGRPGEMFLQVAKQGSTLAGIMDAFAISVSHGLQYGVPLEAFVEMFTNMRFEPAGMTDDPDLRFATSLVDYIFRRLAVDVPRRGQARGDGHHDGGGAPAADAARRRGVDDTERDVDGPPARGPGAVRRAEGAQRAPGTSRRSLRRSGPSAGDRAVPRLRRHDAARRQLLRLPQLRQHQRLLLKSTVGECHRSFGR